MKQCTNCGKFIIDEATTCEYCGTSIIVSKQSKSNKKIFIIAGSIILTLVLAFLLIEYAGLSSSYTALENQERQMENNNQNLSNLLLTSTVIAENYNSVEQDYQVAESLLADQEDEINHLNSTLTASENQISYLEGITYCDETFSPDYTSQASMSVSLINFVAGLGGNPTDGYWETIWSNSSAAIHEVISIEDGGRTGYKFIVFFDDDLYSPSVFYINRQCWLDR